MQERGAEQVRAGAGGMDRRSWTPTRRQTNRPCWKRLWTYQALDIVEPKLLTTLLNAHDYRVRAAAARVAGMWAGRLHNPLELLAPRVRRR